MNIGYLREILPGIDEIKVIGKNANVDGVICNVMGIIRQGTQIRLLVLQYDESYQQSIEEREEAELFQDPDTPRTNRMALSERETQAKNPFDSILKVFIDEREFNVCTLECRRLNIHEWESILTIAEFLKNGWQPDEIDYQDIEMMFLSSLELEGDYTSIPVFDQNPRMRFVRGEYCVVHQVEKPITLVVGGKYPDKLFFRDKNTGAQHWVQINRVYLLDMWEQMEKTLNDPKLQEHMTSEEINRARLDFEKRFSQICPRGMYFPVIEYECEEDISLQFYSQAYLDASPIERGTSIGFILTPDQPTGILGLKLKAAVIQEQVPKNTDRIEAELFNYIFTVTSVDILL
ncbi:MAG TPA: hypothetical protein PKW03_09195 [Acetivibrio sp.]|nr:hypothetical protein [Acetivibrio sp.]HPT91706.1 hypothetical protein [Acetivibrio sp.]